MEEFQQEANKAKQEQQQAANFFNARRDEEQQITRKYDGLSENNHNNVSQFIRPTAVGVKGGDDEYTEKLLDKIGHLEQ